MELTVGRPVKILALILVIAGVGGVASLQMLGKSSSASASAALSVAQVRARAHSLSHTGARRAKPSTTTTPARPAHVSKPAPVRTVAKTPAPVVAPNGLPIVLVDALRAHRVVVVSIFDPQSQTDAVSYAEARAGAAAAGVGFLGVSVLDDTVAGPLTAALPGGGLLPDPGVLVYRAPGTLVQRVDGFNDRDSVAQLAVSGRTATAITATAPAAAAAAAAASVPTATTP